jgi:hypothetical protein
MGRTAIYIITVVILIVFFSSWIGFAQEEVPSTSVRVFPAEKDPFVAGLLSWLMMGTGQMYCHEYTKGSIFIAADLVDKVALVLLVSHINSKYAPSSGEIINIKWDSFDPGTKIITLLYFAGSLTLRFYNVIDAVNSANNYNRRYFTQRSEEGLDFSLGQDMLSVEYKFRFDE